MSNYKISVIRRSAPIDINEPDKCDLSGGSKVRFVIHLVSFKEEPSEEQDIER